MATTTNYSWTTPDDTALVKDGASAIRALGTAIDTSMNTALGTKKAGMVLLNTTSFSAVASQAVPTIFSAAYENYKIVLTLSAATIDASLNLKLRSGATDDSTAYSTGANGLTAANVAQNQYESAVTTGFRINTLDSASSGDFYANSIDLYKPFLATRTTFSMTGAGVSTTSAIFGFAGGGLHNVASSFDGFNIVPGSGNISGKVSVYGYNL
jgi:hypothetical protein